MLKKIMFAVVATAFVAATALPFQIAPAAAEAMTCKAAAKAQFPSDRKARHALEEVRARRPGKLRRRPKISVCRRQLSKKGARLAPFLCSAGTGRPLSGVK